MTYQVRRGLAESEAPQQSSLFSQNWYAQAGPLVAKKLIGSTLVYKNILYQVEETECYLSHSDPANHAFKKKSSKVKEVLFGDPGKLYIYSLFGWCCCNITVEPQNKPAAVLLRSLIRVEEKNILKRITGPGKVAQELGLTLEDSGRAIYKKQKSPFYICSNNLVPVVNIQELPRINISPKDHKPLRFKAQY